MPIIEYISSVVPAGNQFFTGGIGLAALGAAAGVARAGMRSAVMLLRRHALITLEVTSKDPSYPWVLNWLSTQGRKTQHLSVNTGLRRLRDGSKSLQFDFVPGPGRHLLWYSGRMFAVERHRETQMLDLNSGTPWEKVTLTSVGRDPEVFQGLLAEAQELAEQRETGKTIVYTNWGTEWRQFGHPRNKRSLDSVVLDDGVAEAVVSDVHDWRLSADWYQDRGVPYRRGYLLHGPPGSGKSSFIAALAGHLDYSICMMSLNDPGLTDDRLAHALSTAPQQSLILLEDIDAAFSARDASEHNQSSITFSGLLNTLDGVASSEERLLFMTTNHIDKLDRALMRPGRIDRTFLLDDATEAQARRLFENFYRQDVDASAAQIWGEAVSALRVRPSMAELQGHLLNYKESPAEAVAQIHELEASILVGRGSECKAAVAGETTTKTAAPSRPAARKRLTAFDVDRVPFNPQEGWEEAVGLKR